MRPITNKEPFIATRDASSGVTEKTVLSNRYIIGSSGTPMRAEKITRAPAPPSLKYLLSRYLSI